MKKFFLMLMVMVASLSASADGTWKLVKGIDYSTSTWKGWNFNDATHSFKDGALTVTNAAAKGQNYELQYSSLDGVSVEAGENYKVVVDFEADAAGSIFFALCNWSCNGANGATKNFTASRQELSYEFKAADNSAGSNFLMTQSGLFVGTYKIYSINVYKYEEAAPAEIVDIKASLAAEQHSLKLYPATNPVLVDPNEEGIYVVTAPKKVSAAWDTQFWINFNTPITNAEVTLSFDCKASKACSVGTGLHKKPGEWKSGGPSNVDFKTEWTTFNKTFKINNAAGIESFAMDLSNDAEDVTYEFKNIKLSVGLIMGDASLSIENNGLVEIGEDGSKWEGLTISYPNNNLALALKGVPSYGDKGSIKLVGSEAYLYEKGNATPIATEDFAISSEATEVTLFSSTDIEAGKEYTITVAKYGLRLVDMMKFMGDLNEIDNYWMNDKDFSVSFLALAAVPSYAFNEKTANTTTFDMAEATNYDKEAGKFTEKGGWTFAEPVDLSAHKWLIVTTTYNARVTGGEFRITDKNGKSVGGEDYNREGLGGSGSRGNMWLDQWNNQICAKVNMEHLAKMGLDIENIASLQFSANHPVSAVYMTNYEAGKAVSDASGWGACNGDYERAYNKLADGAYKFGTVCLPYAAAVHGAKVYTIGGVEAGLLTLNQVNGVLTAGVPYIYKADDNGGDNSNVKIFRVDANEVADPVADTYLTGVFADEEATVGSYVLQTQDNVQAFYKVGEVKPTVKANHAYLSVANDVKAIYFAETGEETAIESVAAPAVKAVYDLSGRKVNNAQKGIYIISGRKVVK